jgi:hypothetical protein
MTSTCPEYCRLQDLTYGLSKTIAYVTIISGSRTFIFKGRGGLYLTERKRNLFFKDQSEWNPESETSREYVIRLRCCCPQIPEKLSHFSGNNNRKKPYLWFQGHSKILRVNIHTKTGKCKQCLLGSGATGLVKRL